ncbi:MAG: hypothetical protein KC983_03605 [Phycisphaerales bacterium]|nr:hypothetical protein [Phycisphaerales bacterium]
MAIFSLGIVAVVRVGSCVEAGVGATAIGRFSATPVGGTANHSTEKDASDAECRRERCGTSTCRSMVIAQRTSAGVDES